MNERLVSDSGVVRVIVRPVRDDLADMPLQFAWWQRKLRTEPYRVAQGIASALDGGSGKPSTVNYWYGRVMHCVDRGLALAAFAGTKAGAGWQYGSPLACLLALPDSMDAKRAVILWHSRDAFSGEAGHALMLAWANEWAAGIGRSIS